MIKKQTIEKYLQSTESSDHNLSGLPLVVRLEQEQNPTYIHSHRFTELVIILSGKGIHLGNDIRSELARGGVLVIPPGGTHRYEKTENLMLVNILFDLNKLPIPFMDMRSMPGFHELLCLPDDFFLQHRPYPGFQLPEKLLTEIEPLLVNMISECCNSTPGKDFRLLSSFMLLIGKLISAYPVQQLPPSVQIPTYQLSSVIGFLNREFRNDITMSDILKKIPMSRSTLNRNFLLAFGMTPMRYLNKLRLDCAVELLTASTLSVSEIAHQSGFSDSNYFCRIFKKRFNQTPGNWRKHGK